MKDLSKEELRDKLLYTLDYSSDEVEATLMGLMNMSGEGKDILKEYLESGVLPNREKNGLSLTTMRKQSIGDMTDIALILIYDGIQQNLFHSDV